MSDTGFIRYQNSSPMVIFEVGANAGGKEKAEPYLRHGSGTPPHYRAYPLSLYSSHGAFAHAIPPLCPMCFPPFTSLLMPTQLPIPQGSPP